MSTQIGDFRNSVLTVASVFPSTVNDSNVGAVIDLIDADDRCFAIQNIGTVAGTFPTFAGKIQESSDNIVWTDVPTAAFASVTASNNTQVIVFDRSRRFVRHNRSVGGTTPTFALCVLIGQQRKTI